MVGAFQLFHHSQYLRPHRRGQQDGSREYDCQRNQSWRTPRKKRNLPNEKSLRRKAPLGKLVRQNQRKINPFCLPNKKYLSGKNHLGTIGAGDGGRTHTVSPPTDFESVSSANSNTPAQETISLYLLPTKKSSGQAGVSVFFCRTSCFLGPGRV